MAALVGRVVAQF